MLLKLFRKEQGNALVLVSFAMLGLLSITGLVLDGGTLYMTKSHLQKTANAAALSGAQELTGTDEVVVEKIIERVLMEHGESESLKSISMTLEDRVEVELSKEIKPVFLKLFGYDTATVEAQATAEIGTMGRAYGAAPLGIDESIELELYKEYKLKVDQHEVDTGNFGVLALGGTGASTYEENLRNGYKDQIGRGDILDTQTGNISGKTRSVINELVQNCPYSPGDAIERNCSRILLVPVYKPYYTSTNQLKQVEITGFEYFFVTEPVHSNDTTITGIFIKMTGTGIIDPGSSSLGAYSIRLTR